MDLGGRSCFVSLPQNSWTGFSDDFDFFHNLLLMVMTGKI